METFGEAYERYLEPPMGTDHDERCYVVTDPGPDSGCICDELKAKDAAAEKEGA